jgi:hypothetical protein
MRIGLPRLRLLLAASCLVAAGLSCEATHAETRAAAALTSEAVREAIDAAKDGDIVELPAGTAVWSKGWNTGHGAKMKAIVFNNTVTGTTYNIRTIELRNERAWRDLPGFSKADGKNPLDGNQIPAGQLGAGYPCFGQVGWGTNVGGVFNPSPCYAWDNTLNGKPLRMETSNRADANEAATIKEGRDFFNEKPPEEYYKPYIYPHPLQRRP